MNSTSVMPGIEMERAFSALASPVRLPSPRMWLPLMGNMSKLHPKMSKLHSQHSQAVTPALQPPDFIAPTRAFPLDLLFQRAILGSLGRGTGHFNVAPRAETQAMSTKSDTTSNSVRLANEIPALSRPEER